MIDKKQRCWQFRTFRTLHGGQSSFRCVYEKRLVSKNAVARDVLVKCKPVPTTLRAFVGMRAPNTFALILGLVR